MCVSGAGWCSLSCSRRSKRCYPQSSLYRLPFLTVTKVQSNSTQSHESRYQTIVSILTKCILDAQDHIRIRNRFGGASLAFLVVGDSGNRPSVLSCDTTRYVKHVFAVKHHKVIFFVIACHYNLSPFAHSIANLSYWRSRLKAFGDHISSI